MEINLLKQIFQSPSPLFNYPLNITIIPGKSSDEEVLICCHGFGGNSSLLHVLESYHIPEHLIGFNFPDYDIMTRPIPFSQITFGTINELLPLIYILKHLVIDAKMQKISLYGFSAGGAAVINAIAVLNSSQFDPDLLKVGVDTPDKEKILKALQNGIILLDAPLKSMEEIMSPQSDEISRQMAQNYKSSHLRPIDSLERWQGLSLKVILFFQNPDKSVKNRDDKLFIEKLRRFNSTGQNTIFIRDEGGHCGYHFSLWQAFINTHKKLAS